MTSPPSGSPPGGFPRNGHRGDPPCNLLRIRGAMIGIICLLTVGAVVTACAPDQVPRTQTPRNHTPTTTTNPSPPTSSAKTPIWGSPPTQTTTTSQSPPAQTTTTSESPLDQPTYTRDASLDEVDLVAYVADGNPTAVANDIAASQPPTDLRNGAQQAGNITGALFLQYPAYLVGVFPYGTNQSRVMVSKDYRSGYNRYHSYVGGFWVPTPGYSGPGDDYRGGGSGSGK